MRINDVRDAGGVPRPSRFGMLFRRKPGGTSDNGGDPADREGPTVPRYTVYRALRHGLAFSLGQPIHLLRLTALPVLGLFTSLFLFIAYHMAYMAIVPGQFGPHDWLLAIFTGVLFLWSWTALWGRLFRHLFGQWRGADTAPDERGGSHLRLLSAFAFLWSVPLGTGALLIWGSTVFQYAQMASAGMALPTASYRPRSLGQDIEFPWPLLTSSGLVGPMVTVALALLVLFLLVRLGFLIPDAVSARRFNPYRVWRQSQGLFWPTIGLFVFCLPALLMLFGGPITLGIFATYYLHPDLLTEDVKISFVAQSVWDLAPLWPTFLGGAFGVSFCAAFWTAAFGTLYRSRVHP